MRRINAYITLVLVLILIVYLALLDVIAKPLFEQQASELYGAEVTVSSLSLSPFVGKVTLYDLEVADRRNALQNLVQAKRTYIDIDILKLASDIIEIEDMEVEGLLLFGPRLVPATILRPLLPEDSDIAQAGLPTFTIPDVDSLMALERESLTAEIDTLQASFVATEEKWREKTENLPTAKDIDDYKQRIRELKQAKGVADRVTALRDVQQIYAEVNQQISGMQSMQQEFRGDIQRMREKVDLAATLPEKYVNRIVSSLGLSSGQMAQLGNQMLRGDLDGLLEQVLAPLAYSADGQIDPQQTMPIHIRNATIAGNLLVSAPGLNANGRLQNFAWPLESADQEARLTIGGTSIDGGSLLINALIDHRDEILDRVTVKIEGLPLQNMQLEGFNGLDVTLVQTLVTIAGQLSIDGGNLQGEFIQQFSDAAFQTELTEDAGAAARLISAMLLSNPDYQMQVNFSGTLQSPQLSFRSDLDKLIEETLRSAISGHITALTNDLQNQMSSEIGPEVARARSRFQSLEKLQTQLRGSLQELNSLTP